jgi:UPF0755 protein
MFFAGVSSVGWEIWTVVTPIGQGDPRIVEVQTGQTVSEVADMLWETGLIRSKRTFVAAAYVTRQWSRVQAGRHELGPSMSLLEILDALCRQAQRDWRWTTIPEGYTLAETAAKIEEERLGRAADFLHEASRPQTFEVAFPLPHDSLEGYLFPDTYRVDTDQTERDMVAQMLRRFEQVVWRDLHGGKDADDEWPLRKTLILASMVEKEAQREEERAVIAGVYVNRLRRGQLLECDATVQYALGDKRKARLTYEDLEIDSPYNTYLHAGLPPGPICSPGEASIRAAMAPATVPYLYYVARPDGSHVFSRTFEEHRAAIARVRRGR